MFVLYVAFAITGVYHGTGQHTWDIQPATEVPIGLKVLRSLTVMHIDSRLILVLYCPQLTFARTGGFASLSTSSPTWPSKPASL